jgi:CRISPR-associated protein Csm5
MTPKHLSDLSERATSEGRLPRNPGRAIEEGALGSGGGDAMRLVSAGDSNTVAENSFKIYLLRASTLEARGPGKFELAWKQAPRGNTKRLDDSTPVFAEMAVPGTTFEGGWHENEFVAKSPRNRSGLDAARMFGLVNAYAEQLLQLQKQYAEWTGLAVLKANLEQLESKLSEVRQSDKTCLLPLGWSAGFLSKVATLDTQDEAARQILRQVGFYARAIQTGMPFPKTRKIVFLANQPATLAGFVQLQVL